MLGLIVLAIAVSMDGFAAGFAFGMKKITIPWLSTVIIGLSSGTVIALAMPAGNGFLRLVPAQLSHWIGASIFICIGVVSLCKRNFSQADRDQSGEISAKESLLLGLALSVDSIAAGFSAALLGFTIWVTALTIAISCVVFIRMGKQVGVHLSAYIQNQYFSFIPGVLLLILGVSKLL